MTFGGGIVAAVKNKQYLRRLKERGAVGETNAKSLVELEMQEDIVLKRLIVLDAVGKKENKYYITEKFSASKRFEKI